MSDFIEIAASKNSLANRKLIYGFGVNDAWYLTQPIINGSRVRCPYNATWHNMIKRCYSEVFHLSRPTYKDCYVCDEWLIFSNFKAWMEKQDWQSKHLDKDILNQGNKIYSTGNCIFVTGEINCLLLDNKSTRGDMPIGVSFFKRDGNYKSQIKIKGINTHLGYYDTPELAHEAYKVAKYAHIKEIALQQDEPLCSALLKYKI